MDASYSSASMSAGNLLSMVCSTLHAAGCAAIHSHAAGYTAVQSMQQVYWYAVLLGYFFLFIAYFVILLVDFNWSSQTS